MHKENKEKRMRIAELLDHFSKSAASLNLFVNNGF